MELSDNVDEIVVQEETMIEGVNYLLLEVAPSSLIGERSVITAAVKSTHAISALAFAR